MDEILAQTEIQGAILALAARLSSGPDGTMDSRLLDSFMFRLPTACSANFPQSGVTRMMRIHLQSLEKIASNRLADNAPSGGQPHREAHKGPMQRHGDEPQDHEPQDHGGDPLLHRTDERIRRRDRDPDGDKQSQQGALQTGKKQKVQPVGLANQCRDVLIEWLRQKAADEAFGQGGEDDLVNAAIQHLKSTVLQPKANNYGKPARFHQAITPRQNLWAQFEALRQDPNTRVTRRDLMPKGSQSPSSASAAAQLKVEAPVHRARSACLLSLRSRCRNV